MGQSHVKSLDSFKSRKEIEVAGKTYEIFSLVEAEKNGLEGLSKLPYSLKVLAENLLRFEDGSTVTKEDIEAMAKWARDRSSKREIAYRPARVLMQDFTGVPAVVDLAAMRDAMANLGGDPSKINPLVPVDLVIDHSVMVDHFGSKDSFAKNVDREYERNKERYTFLKWGAEAFDNFRVVPPGTGICHQVNLEYLSQTIWTKDVETNEGTITQAFPDTLVGTDSHTTMVNGLSVLGWGVGGIEAEAAMLGQPISMLIPEVIGFEIKGTLKEGMTATDLVLRVVELLREKGVVGKFVEFYGEGLDHLSLEDKATIANMAPEYGATCGFFPIDQSTLDYLHATGRDDERIALVETFAKEQGMYRTGQAPVFTDTLSLDLSTIEPSLSGPKRPQDRVALSNASTAFANVMGSEFKKTGDTSQRFPVAEKGFDLGHGDVVIAAITSCTNTSNPSVLMAAGLLARNAIAKGLDVKPWVKTSLAPGSQVVTDYLTSAGLLDDLNGLGFNVVGYGCTTCIGNSGPLDPAISKTIHENELVATSVLSGNRNFEGRISPDIKANYLASPPLVVAYALAGSLNVDMNNEPLGEDKEGNPVYLKDIWPTNEEITQLVRKCVTRDMFLERYGEVFKGDEHWQKIGSASSLTYGWDGTSTYVQNPPYFEELEGEAAPIGDIQEARILGLFLDSITTDHISPAGAIKAEGPAGSYLTEHQIRPLDFNSFGARRGNHEIMMRGTFANIRIKNQMLDGVEGGYTRHYPGGEQEAIYDAAMKYAATQTPLVVFAGKEYGTGSSRDWAAKGTRLLGVRAVIAQSFERIHRSNLIGMGVLPLIFANKDENWQTLGLDGSETVSISGLSDIKPQMTISATITKSDGSSQDVDLLVRIDTEDELTYWKNGGILHYVLRTLAA